MSKKKKTYGRKKIDVNRLSSRLSSASRKRLYTGRASISRDVPYFDVICRRVGTHGVDGAVLLVSGDLPHMGAFLLGTPNSLI